MQNFINKKEKRDAGLFLLLLIGIFPATAPAYFLFQKETSRYGYELALDAYYSYFEFYIPFKEKKREYLPEAAEARIYNMLFKRAFIPQFFLAEASVYPLPWVGVYLKENSPDFYASANIGGGFNWIRSLCAGFEEPWAFSLLLGNLVSFEPEGKKKKGAQGKAYLGYLASFGAYHIKDNTLIKDPWTEIEWKIKGERVTPERSMSWSFRLGAKFHSHPEIKDIWYLSLKRERIDYGFYGFSLLKNTSLEYTMDIGGGLENIIRHYFLIGKSFPFKAPEVVFQLHFGFIKEEGEKYTGSLRRTEERDNFYYIIRPNLKF